MLVIDDSVVRALEAVDIPEAAFEESADKVGEAVVQISHDQTTSPLRDFGARDRWWYLQSKESKSFKRLLQAALVDKSRRAQSTATIVVILRRKDEGSEPEVGKDPGERSEVALVGFHEGQDEGGEVEESVDSGLVGVILACMFELVR
jgi:hypothetical protein